MATTLCSCHHRHCLLGHSRGTRGVLRRLLGDERPECVHVTCVLMRCTYIFAPGSLSGRGGRAQDLGNKAGRGALGRRAGDGTPRARVTWCTRTRWRHKAPGGTCVACSHLLGHGLAMPAWQGNCPWVQLHLHTVHFLLASKPCWCAYGVHIHV